MQRGKLGLSHRAILHSYLGANFDFRTRIDSDMLTPSSSRSDLSMLRRYPERTRTHHPAVRCTILLGLCGSFLITCSNMALAEASDSVIARIGKQEITAAELENELRRASVPPEQRSDEVTKRILGDLVKRKYLAQRAIAVGLDRKPFIQSEIVRASSCDRLFAEQTSSTYRYRSKRG